MGGGQAGDELPRGAVAGTECAVGGRVGSGGAHSSGPALDGGDSTAPDTGDFPCCPHEFGGRALGVVDHDETFGGQTRTGGDRELMLRGETVRYRYRVHGNGGVTAGNRQPLRVEAGDGRLLRPAVTGHRDDRGRGAQWNTVSHSGSEVFEQLDRLTRAMPQLPRAGSPLP